MLMCGPWRLTGRLTRDIVHARGQYPPFLEGLGGLAWDHDRDIGHTQTG